MGGEVAQVGSALERALGRLAALARKMRRLSVCQKKLGGEPWTNAWQNGRTIREWAKEIDGVDETKCCYLCGGAEHPGSPCQDIV